MADRTPHGLVIGKFYPPHSGHHLLIRAAAAASERVTVLVLSHEVESIPHATRLGWLREVHAGDSNVSFEPVVDDHPVDFLDPAVWDLHEAVFRAGVASVTAAPVTAVFSSEPYGPELARRFGAEPVAVDAERGQEPVSGTAVRDDPIAHWDRLAPCVRAWFVRRVVVDGDAERLADALRARGGAFAATEVVVDPAEVEASARRGGPVLLSTVEVAGADRRIPADADALATVDGLLAEGWDLAPPRLPAHGTESI